MFKAGLSLTSNAVFATQSIRSFARVPMIKFIGKRAKHNKSLSFFAEPESASGASAATDAPDLSNKKAISPKCELEFADIPADRWARLPISELEMDTIN